MDQSRQTGAAARLVDAPTLRRMLDDRDELAIIDVREELIFSQSHLLHARSVPLSRLELLFAALVPRRGTRIVLCDDNEGAAQRAATILAAAGYSDVAVLDGGVAGWQRAGFELFSGVNVPSKAFGEFIEHSSHTPSVAPEELAQMMRDGTNMKVLDSRPFDEYFRVSIPSATSVPGAELVLRARDAAPSPDTTIVVNCAGRTRSIIGAQSLINAGIPNKVVALRNGTMGWSLAGFTCDAGKEVRAPAVSPTGLAAAREAAARVARRFGIKHIDRATLERWQLGKRAAHALSPRCPRSHRLCRRTSRRRHFRAGRPARPGHRSICRHAALASRSRRRSRCPRRHDRLLAGADGLGRGVCPQRKRR